MLVFPRVSNGNIQCSSCGMRLSVAAEKCYKCGTENLLSHIEVTELEKVSEDDYDNEIVRILRSKGISMDEQLKKAEENITSINNTRTKKQLQFPNTTAVVGVIFITVGLFAGEILLLIGWGNVIQQIAISIALSLFGIGLILLGSFKAVIIRLDKILSNDPE
jgi:ribosomal protein L40E